LGQALLVFNQTSEARDEFKTALQFDRGNADAHFQLGRITLREGNVEEASADLHEAIRLNPDLVDAHFELGKAYEQLNRFDAAEREFRAAIALKPEMVEAIYGLTRVLRKTGRTEEAKSYLEQFEKLQQRDSGKDFAATLNKEGNKLRAQGRLEDAAASYK
jgi:protein O-GlcNAc transferase